MLLDPQAGILVQGITGREASAMIEDARAYGSNIVAGRIGDSGQNGEPYQVMVNSANGSSACASVCQADTSGDGFVACNAGGAAGIPITVWRKFISAPAISFERDLAGFTVDSSITPTSLTLSTDRAIDGSHSLHATINATANSTSTIQLLNPSGLVPGKNLTVFINVPRATNWSYLQAFAQDGPGKSYRWTGNGINQVRCIPGEWNSIVVPIPSDFSASGSRIGLALGATTAGTIDLYVDAIFLQ